LRTGRALGADVKQATSRKKPIAMALDPLHSGFPLPSERPSTPVNQIGEEADLAFGRSLVDRRTLSERLRLAIDRPRVCGSDMGLHWARHGHGRVWSLLPRGARRSTHKTMKFK
jgi:hypothetical protein